MTETHRERRSCSVLNPANDWLRIMPLGPPGEWVPAAMISGTRDDTPGEKTHTNPQWNIHGASAWRLFRAEGALCKAPASWWSSACAMWTNSMQRLHQHVYLDPSVTKSLSSKQVSSVTVFLPQAGVTKQRFHSSQLRGWPFSLTQAEATEELRHRSALKSHFAWIQFTCFQGEKKKTQSRLSYGWVI